MLEARKKHGGMGVQALSVIGILQIVGGLYSLIQDPKQYAFAGLIAFGFFLTFLSRIQVWLLFRQNKKIQEQFDATISDNGIEISSSTAISKYAWDEFVRYSETKNLFLVYPSQQVFNVFPKQAFTCDEADDFRKLLELKLGSTTMANQKKKISPRVWAFLAVVVVAAILLVRAILNILHSTPGG